MVKNRKDKRLLDVTTVPGPYVPRTVPDHDGFRRHVQMDSTLAVLLTFYLHCLLEMRTSWYGMNGELPVYDSHTCVQSGYLGEG